MKQDLYLNREQKKYSNPIASREYILSIVTKKKNISKLELIDILQLDDTSKKALSYRIRAMLRDKQLSINTKQELVLFNEKNLLTGKIIANPRGFGFVVLKDDKDLRLSKTQMQLVFHNEIISVRKNFNDVQIVSFKERIKTIVGKIIVNSNEVLLEADDIHINHKILIPKLNKDNKHNQVVVAKIINYPTKNTLTKVKIIKVIGNYLTEGVAISSALFRYQIEEDFNEKTSNEANKIPDKVLDIDKKNKKDLRKLALITIDGDDSKDFDDAVYAKKDNDNWRLWVAIADVSHYVVQDSALDKSAKERSTSVYFPNKVIPMLPNSLSNNLCSLKPDVIRLCLTCELVVNSNGEVIDYKFYQAFMHSHARMTYDEVNDILTNNKVVEKNIYDNLLALKSLYTVLAKARQERGAMVFNSSESKMLFLKNGKLDNIVKKQTNIAHNIIEECMLLANKSCAEYLSKHKKQNFLYRIHPKPKDNKIQNVLEFLQALGIEKPQDGNIDSKYLTNVLEQTKTKDNAHFIQTIILRSMQQAVYSNKNTGHFGLALKEYTHFTSPIRRYPDLLTHRAIKNIINNDNSNYKNATMNKLGEHCSEKERNADDASRDVEKWLKCEFMSHRINQKYKGVISGVAGFGLFVELTDIYIDGVVPITKLNDDYYLLDEANYRLVGKSFGKVYSLGDAVKINVVKVSLSDRKIELELL